VTLWINQFWTKVFPAQTTIQPVFFFWGVNFRIPFALENMMRTHTKDFGEKMTLIHQIFTTGSSG
jgi:hypothetical protein